MLASPSNSKDLPLNGGSRVDLAVLTIVASWCSPSFLSGSPVQYPHPSLEELREGQGLCHGHCYLLDEAGQVYVPFWKARTLVSAQGDVDLKQNQRFQASWFHQLNLRAGGSRQLLGSSRLWRVTRHSRVTGSPRGCLLDQSLTGQNCLLFHLHEQWWLQHRIKKKDPNIKSNLKAKDKTPDQLHLLNTVHL